MVWLELEHVSGAGKSVLRYALPSAGFLCPSCVQVLSPEKESGEVLKSKGASEPTREPLTTSLWGLPREFLGSNKFPGSADLDSTLGDYCLETAVIVLEAAVCWGHSIRGVIRWCSSARGNLYLLFLLNFQPCDPFT